MVRVNGPMFSLGASGTLANTVVFSIWKGRPYVRERVVPSNPKSGAQTGRRGMFTFLTQAWAALTTAEKATWEVLADSLVISPFNAYVKFNMDRWHNYGSPTQETPPTETGAGSDNVITAAVWEENRIKITLAGSTLQDTWGIVIYADTSAAIDESVGNAILVLPDTTIASHDVFWTPPSVTTWYFDSTTFSDDGVLESPGGEDSAVP